MAEEQLPYHEESNTRGGRYEKISFPPDDWDKSKAYFSPSGEMVAVFIKNKWTTYVRNDVVGQHVQDAIKLYDEKKHL